MCVLQTQVKSSVLDGFLMKWSRLLLYIFGTFIACIAMGIGIFCAMLHTTSVDITPLIAIKQEQPTIVLDANGNELFRFAKERREAVGISMIPQHVIDAFIATEDWKFFEHHGLSLRGIVRSLLVNLIKGQRAQGASTITQQLVRLLFFDAQKTFKRKIKEQFYALVLEYQCTKEQILLTYLNTIYFGCGIYGVEAACQRFWGICVKDISVDQAAVLAAIVSSPARYCPLLHPDNAQTRRDLVLFQMQRCGFLTLEQKEYFQSIPVTTNAPKQGEQYAHLKELVRQNLEEKFGSKTLYEEGLVVQTTIDASIQQAAQKAFCDHVAQLRTTLQMPIDGGLLSLDHNTGQIKAVVGGYNFYESRFNRACQAYRQIGSIFKTLIYAHALSQNAEFNHVEVDEPVELQLGNAVWKPKNHDGIFKGNVTLAYALSYSNNMVVIKTLLKYGFDGIFQLAEQCGITMPTHRYPSLALGCVDTTLLQATSMFSIFPACGILHEPYMIRWVKNRWGEKLFYHQEQQKKVLDSIIVSKVSKVLEHSMTRIRAWLHEQIVDCDVISKTGTTNDSRTCWFVGATPELTTGIYIGCDDNRALGKNIYPIHTAFPIWSALYKSIASSKQLHFKYDPSLRSLFIDKFTGESLTHQGPRSIEILV